VAAAIAGVGWQAREAAALAVGIEISTARRCGFLLGYGGIGHGALANGCGVHG